MKNSASFHIYKLLAWLIDSPMSGYDIKKKVESAAQLFGSHSNSQIYPLLKQLEHDKWVSSQIDKASGKRARKIYTITTKGKKNLLTWLLEPTEPTTYKDELLIKISMGFHISEQDCKSNLQYYRKKLDKIYEAQLEKLDHIKHHHKNDKKQQYLMMSHQHLLMITEARIKWCKLCIKELNEELHANDNT